MSAISMHRTRIMRDGKLVIHCMRIPEWKLLADSIGNREIVPKNIAIRRFITSLTHHFGHKSEDPEKLLAVMMMLNALMDYFEDGYILA